MSNTSKQVRRITLTALLVAIIFLLAFTPLGYLTIGPIAATTVQMPVIIGAILLGPSTGTLLGAAFGLSAIMKVLLMPGADPFATMAMNYSPLRYIVICVASRVLMGWLTGLLGKALKSIPRLEGKKKAWVRYGVTGFVGSMLNTVFYLSLLWALAAQVIAQAYGTDISSVGGIVMTTAISAGIPEAIVSSVVVTAICKALDAVKKRA